MPFDPVFDLSLVRATYALRRALELNPEDFKANLLLDQAFKSRLMYEEELDALERLRTLTPINTIQRTTIEQSDQRIDELRHKIGPPPPARWDNLSELSQIVNGLIASGRIGRAADYLENAAPADARSWEETDRIATLRLHLGQTERARALWSSGADAPKRGLRASRIGFARLVEGDFEAARQSFTEAIAADPELFDAHYGLAILEQDAGRAAESLTAARKAVSIAPSDVARNAAQGIVATVTPYAHSALAR